MKSTKNLLPFLFLILIGCQSKSEVYYHLQGEIFRTKYNIKYQYNRPLNQEIEEKLKAFDLSLNPFNRSSVIYKINNNIDSTVDEWFKTVFLKAFEISELTGGSYDITTAPLINLWGFGFEKIGEATPEKVDSLKQFVGYRKIRLKSDQIIKEDPRVQLNASSIAKGFSCDVIAELLESYEINDYMVEIGGEIRAKGLNPNGECWQIQIDIPIDDITGDIHERMKIIPLCNQSLATSGNYRNYFVKDGKKYAHTIDPFSGYPAESNLLSVSVVYSDCMTADAWATAFMTMDLEKAIALAKTIPGLNYLFIYMDEETGAFSTTQNF